MLVKKPPRILEDKDYLKLHHFPKSSEIRYFSGRTVRGTESIINHPLILFLTLAGYQQSGLPAKRLHVTLNWKKIDVYYN